MIDLTSLSNELSGSTPDDSTIEAPCPKHTTKGACVRITLTDGQLHAVCLYRCKEEDLLAAYAEKSAVVRALLKGGDADRYDGNVSRRVGQVYGSSGQASEDNARAAGVTAGGSATESTQQKGEAYTDEAEGPGDELDGPPEQNGRPESQDPNRNPKNLHTFTLEDDGPAAYPNSNAVQVYESAPVSDILKRPPPQNIEVEQCLLGSIFLEPAIMDDVARFIVPSDFYKESHLQIYKAMVAAYRAGHEIDAKTIAHELKQKQILESVGGAGYLAELAECVPTSLNSTRYIEIVKELAIKRDVIRSSMEMIDRAHNGSTLEELRSRSANLVPQYKADSLPVLIAPDIQILSGKQFAVQQLKVKRDWLIQGMLAKKEISLWSGKVEHGKTTLIRTLVMCVLRGCDFLERQVTPGRVLYVMLDADGEGLTFEMFTKMGMDWDQDPIDLLIDPVMALRPRSFEQFHEQLLTIQPSLVVIDPVGRFQKIEEKDGGFNGYGMTYAMAKFSELAKQTNCHMLLLHHIPRGRNDSDDPATAAFGSVAIAGGCNARFSCIKKPGDIFIVTSSKGKGGGFIPFDGEQKLAKDSETEWVTLAGAFSWKDQSDAIQPKVLEIVKTAERWMSTNEIAQEANVQRSIAGAAAKSLYKRGEIDMHIAGHNRHLWAIPGLQSELKP